MKKSSRSHKEYRREFCTEMRFCDIPVFKKIVRETIYPIPEIVKEEEKTSVNGFLRNQVGSVGASVAKVKRRKTKLPKT